MIALHQDGFKAALENMAHFAVNGVVLLGVRAIELAHPFA